MITLKVIFHGSAGIGKTNLVQRLGGNKFEKETPPTIGVNLLTLQSPTGRYQLWDLSGQERFRPIVKQFYPNSAIVCLCFDPRKINSFRKTKNEIDMIKYSAPPDCQFILVETCSDLQDSPEVSEEEIDQFKKEQGIRYHVKTSAKNNNDPGLDQLKDIFDTISLDKMKQQESQEKQQETVEQETPTEPHLNDSESENNYSFLLKAVIATAAAGGIGLCVAAILTAAVVGSIPLAASLLAGGVVLTAVAAVGTFFYHRSNQNEEDGQSIEHNNEVPTY